MSPSNLVGILDLRHLSESTTGYILDISGGL